MKSIFALLLISAVAFAGCGTLFHTRPMLEIIGPRDVVVENTKGEILPEYADELEHSVYTDRMRTDSVRVVYHDKVAVVPLDKTINGSEIFNVLTAGLGFVLDDLTHTWFNYAPLYITVDSGKTGLHGITVTNSNWFGESHSERQIHMLITAGPSLSFQMDGSSPFLFGGVFPSPKVAWQFGAGIDVLKQAELFYLTRTESGYPITGDKGADVTDITSQDVCFRYFFRDNYFAQAALGTATANNQNPFSTQFPFSANTNAITEMGLAVGWAGDISYVSLQFFTGLRGFDLGYLADIRYHTVYLSAGLNFRL